MHSKKILTAQLFFIICDSVEEKFYYLNIAWKFFPIKKSKFR